MSNEISNKPIGRREFFKKMGILAGGGAILSAFPWLEGCSQEEKQEITGRKLRIGIVGTGSRGMYHINHLKMMSDQVEVVALCDNYEPSLQQAAAEYPAAKTFSDYRFLLELKEVEAVIIATPLFAHAPITLDALDAGKHVFCEKSMSDSLQGCLDMYNASKNGKNILYIGQQRLYDKKYLRAMEMIHSGVIGDITGVRAYWFRNNDWRREVPSPELERKINWRLYKDLSGGLMTELATHQLQVGNWAMKAIPESVVGYGDIVHWKDGRDVYDNVSLIYRYSNGVKMTYESNIANKFNGLEEEILGHKGTMELEKGLYHFEEATPAPAILQLINQAEHAVLDKASFASPSWVPETASSSKGIPIIAGATVVSGESSVGAMDDGSFELLAAFIEAAKLNRPAKNLIEEAYYSSTLALLGLQAIEEQRMIKYPDEFKIPYLNFA
ncbi:MAG: Gfo/Idh/MocA family oxidoreductase [Rikenellaceae bacterium]